MLIRLKKIGEIMSKTFGLFMLFIGSSLVIIYHLATGVPLSKLFIYYTKEVGMAVLIAMVLWIAIEKRSEKAREKSASEYIVRLTKDFFKTIYNHHVPSKVWNEVESTILQNNSYLRNVDIDYHITELDNDYVEVEMLVKYDLVNGAEHDIAVPLSYGLDTFGLEKHFDKVGIFEFNIWRKNKLASPILFSGKERLTFSTNVFVNPDTFAHIQIKATTVKRSTDMDFTVLSQPTENVQLSVNIPKRFNVDVVANHSKKMKLHKSNGDTKVYSLQSGLFPYQSIIIRWKPNSQ